MLPTVCYLLSLRVRLCMCACEREHGIQKVKATVIEENRKWVGVGGREGGEETENELISLLPHPFCFPQMNLSCYLMICFFGSQAIHIPCYLCVSPPPPPPPPGYTDVLVTRDKVCLPLSGTISILKHSNLITLEGH